VCVGEPVLDIWGAFCDPMRTRAWEHGTFSSTKTMTALGAMVLVDRGAIDLDRWFVRPRSEVRLLRRETGPRILEVQPIRWTSWPATPALGPGLRARAPRLNLLHGDRFTGHRIAFWGGSGGPIVVNDIDERMTIMFAMHKHVEHGGIDQRSVVAVSAVYDALAATRCKGGCSQRFLSDQSLNGIVSARLR